VPASSAFHVEGVIVRVIQPGVYRVELPNGHELLGYVTRRDRARMAGLVSGQKVELELSPFDLSKGRVRAVGASET
jgi:translation initiation factor IF-1